MTGLLGAGAALDGLLGGIKWKIGAVVGGIGMVGCAVALLFAHIENRHLTKVNDNLDRQINAPKVGYVARLADAEHNTALLKGEIVKVNGKLKQQADESARKLAETTAIVARVQRENVTLKQQAARLLATPPKGDTLEARMRDVDARVLEGLK